jgi:hypothetical protein
MVDWIETSPEDAWKVPTEEVLGELAKRARVPDASRESFYHSVCGTVEAVWHRDKLFKRGPSAKKKGSLARAADAALTLHDALGTFGKPELEHLQKIFPLLSAEEFGSLRQNAYQLSKTLNAAMGRPPPRDLNAPPRPNRRGRKPDAVKDVLFRRFAYDLQLDAMLAGGRFTVDRNSAKGSFIEGMKLLARHLPPDFVPKRPPATTLDRFRTWCGQTSVGPNMKSDDLWMYSLYPRSPT